MPLGVTRNRKEGLYCDLKQKDSIISISVIRRTMVSLSDFSDIYFISSTHSGYFTTDPDRSDCFSASARSAYPFSGT